MIDKSVLLPLDPDAAFTLFTSRIGEWWPADRRHLKDPDSQLHLLPTGRFYERASDGTELDLGRVIAWEAPHRLLLAFYVGTDMAHPTEVEVRFTPEGDGTRVGIRHNPTDRSAELWHQRAPAYERSWQIVLAALKAAATERA